MTDKREKMHGRKVEPLELIERIHRLEGQRFELREACEAALRDLAVLSFGGPEGDRLRAQLESAIAHASGPAATPGPAEKSKAVVDLERVVVCLRFELNEVICDDVAAKVNAVVAELAAVRARLAMVAP